MSIFISTFILCLSLMLGSCQVKGTADQRYNLGLRYAIDGKFEKAKDEFEKALILDSSYRPATSSLKVIEEVLDRKLQNESVSYFFKAISSSNAGRLDEAISYLGTAINQDPDFFHAFYERGLLFGYKGEFDRAIADFTRSLELNPNDPEAYNNRGLTYARGKNLLDKAIFDFTKAIQIDPGFADAYNNRGIAHSKKSEAKQMACSDWKRACDLGKCDSYDIAKKNGYCPSM